MVDMILGFEAAVDAELGTSVPEQRRGYPYAATSDRA